MRLLKALFWGGIAYLIYQVFIGQRQEAGAGVSSGRQDLAEAFNEDRGRMAPLTGPARGETVTTEDVSGTSVPHIVGRGVTHER